VDDLGEEIVRGGRFGIRTAGGHAHHDHRAE
jgi:hypothetical protein